MSDILDEASALVECQQCPWYKTCVVPMKLSTEEFRKQLEQTMPGAGYDSAKGNELYDMLLNAAVTSQGMYLEACPIFVRRLKSSPKLADRLKEIMRSWGTEAT